MFEHEGIQNEKWSHNFKKLYKAHALKYVAKTLDIKQKNFHGRGIDTSLFNVPLNLLLNRLLP